VEIIPLQITNFDFNRFCGKGDMGVRSTEKRGKGVVGTEAEAKIHPEGLGQESQPPLWSFQGTGHLKVPHAIQEGDSLSKENG